MGVPGLPPRPIKGMNTGTRAQLATARVAMTLSWKTVFVLLMLIFVSLASLYLLGF
jgi:hypothetical protein